MKSLAPVLLLCTSTAFAGPFAEVSLSVRQQLSHPPEQRLNINGADVHIESWRMYDVNYTKNPYCSVRVGYKWELSHSFNIGVGLGHESSITTGKDRGINDLRLTLRWE